MNHLNDLHNLLQEEIDRIERQIGVLLQPNRKVYTVKNRLNAFEDLNEEEFRRRFRLSKDTVRELHSLIGEQLEQITVREQFNLTAMDKILIALRYYATASFQLVCADFYGVSETTVGKIIPVVSAKIAALRESFIKMPRSDEEIEQKKLEFFRLAGMPCIICAIDGTLVKIQEVGGAQNKTDFFCRKQYYAINTQITCDANAFVMDIVARWPGSTHDETVFLNSSLFDRFLAGDFMRNGVHSLILGDGGYRSEEFLVVPLRENHQERTHAEELYQKSHISTRNVVERFMGQWKKRFPCLWIGMRFRKLQTTLDVIVATSVLHNICKICYDQPPPLTPEDEIEYNIALNDDRVNAQNQPPQNRPTRIVNVMLRNYFEKLAAQRYVTY